MTKSGNFICRIISLGNLNNPQPLVITNSTYAYKIFSSQLNIDDVCYNFFESDECINSVTHYIGRVRSLKEYRKIYENFKVPADYDNPNTMIARVRTVDGLSRKTVYFSNFCPYRECKMEDIICSFKKVLDAKDLEKYGYEYRFVKV